MRRSFVRLAVVVTALLASGIGPAEAKRAKKGRGSPSPPPSPSSSPTASAAATPVPPPFRERRPAAVRERTPEARVFAELEPSLAGITAIRPVEKGGTSNGSAFVIEESGLLLTNNHVIAGASEILVRLSDERTLPARLAGADPALDLAVLRIDPGTKLLPVWLGDSDALSVGDPVLAMGNPLGLGSTLTRGIVSGKERRVDVGAVGLAGTPVAFLQTDAAVNPGSSGGPLVDMEGNVVGVTTATIPHAKGVAFAIPVNVVKKAIPEMLRNAGTGRAFLGLVLGAANASGAEVLSVRPGGPADRAGLKSGDVVTSMRGRTISTDLDLADAVRDIAVHETVRILYLRRGRVNVAELTVGPVPVAAARVERVVLGGATVAEFGPESTAATRSGQSRGVMFAAVPKDSGAGKAGVKAGDVLVVLGMDAVSDLDDLRVLLDRSDADGFRIMVRRGEDSLTLILPR